MFDERSQEFQLRATYGMSEAIIAEIRDDVSASAKRRSAKLRSSAEPSRLQTFRRSANIGLRYHLRAGYPRPADRATCSVSTEIVGALVVRRKAARRISQAHRRSAADFRGPVGAGDPERAPIPEDRGEEPSACMASENKSQFVSSMSHELRTPLNAIIGLTEMMVTNAARFGTEKALEPLQRVNRAGTHLLGLINQVLDLSKIEAGKLELNPQTVQLVPLIEEVIGTARQLAEQNKNRLTAEAPDDLGALTR